MEILFARYGDFDFDPRSCSLASSSASSSSSPSSSSSQQTSALSGLSQSLSSFEEVSPSSLEELLGKPEIEVRVQSATVNVLRYYSPITTDSGTAIITSLVTAKWANDPSGEPLIPPGSEIFDIEIFSPSKPKEVVFSERGIDDYDLAEILQSRLVPKSKQSQPEDRKISVNESIETLVSIGLTPYYVNRPIQRQLHPLKTFSYGCGHDKQLYSILLTTQGAAIITSSPSNGSETYALELLRANVEKYSPKKEHKKSKTAGGQPKPSTADTPTATSSAVTTPPLSVISSTPENLGENLSIDELDVQMKRLGGLGKSNKSGK